MSTRRKAAADEDQPSAPKAAWESVLQIAGAVGGLGVLVYVIGAVTMWVRLWKAGYAPDLGVQHQSRSFLIGLGIRGVLWVALILAGVVAGAIAAKTVYLFIKKHRPDRAIGRLVVRISPAWLKSLGRKIRTAAKEASSWILPRRPFAAIVRGLRRLERQRKRHPAAVFGLTLAAAVVGFSFLGWRSFAVSIAAAVGLALAWWYPDSRAPAKGVLAIAVLVVTAITAGVCWQIGQTAKVQGVFIWPVPERMVSRSPSPDLLSKVAFPYFGENGKFVYVGEIRSVLPSLRQKGRYDFNVCGEPSAIIEVKRDDVQLTFATEDDFLYRDVDSPGLGLWHSIFGRGEKRSRPNSRTSDRAKVEYEEARRRLCDKLHRLSAETAEAG